MFKEDAEEEDDDDNTDLNPDCVSSSLPSCPNFELTSCVFRTLLPLPPSGTDSEALSFP